MPRFQPESAGCTLQRPPKNLLLAGFLGAPSRSPLYLSDLVWAWAGPPRMVLQARGRRGAGQPEVRQLQARAGAVDQHVLRPTGRGGEAPRAGRKKRQRPSKNADFLGGKRQLTRQSAPQFEGSPDLCIHLDSEGPLHKNRRHWLRIFAVVKPPREHSPQG